MQLDSWLETLAAKQPAPGGGAAAGLAAAAAAALVGMVTVYTTGPKWQEQETAMLELNELATTYRTTALHLMQDDEQAFGAVGTAYALPRDTDAQKSTRKAAIQSALIAAAQPPVQIATVATDIVSACETLVTSSNPNVISDVAVAASLARAAIESAIVNIEINAKLIQDAAQTATLQAAVADGVQAMTRATLIISAVRQRIAA